jgi:hypothetical protein
MMLFGALAKASYGTAVVILFAQHRLATSTFAVSMVDWIFVDLFVASYMRTAEAEIRGS